MSFNCKRCGQAFADREAFRLHYSDAYRETSYDTNMQEIKSGHYLRCRRDSELHQYFERDEGRVYHLKANAALHIKADRGFITRAELAAIVEPFNVSAEEIIKKLPDISIRGNRYSPQGIEKTKALEIARNIWFEA